MNTSAPVAPAARFLGGGGELCHLTVSGPARRADLAIPSTATLGELLPIVVRHTVGDADSGDGAWVLQRLGGPPLDFGGTAESLDLREGEVLYLSPETAILPELDFDDVSVGVAHSVSRRADHWRPGFSTALMLGAGAVVAVAFGFCVTTLPSVSARVLFFGLAAAALALVAIIDSRFSEGSAPATAAALGACAYTVLTGFAAYHGAHGLFTVDRKALMITGFAGAAVAVLLATAGRLPLAVFGAVAGVGVCTAIGATAANGLNADAASVVAVLAVVLYAATSAQLRIVLRLARLRVALLPRTAEELQQDIDPVSESDVTARTTRAVSHLNALFVTASLVDVTAFGWLAFQPGWVGWTLTAVFALALVLRARSLTLAWQRAPLVLSGVAGLSLVAVSLARHLGSGDRAWALLLLLFCATALIAAARTLPGRRLLPIWGQLADTAELWTSLALIPLLLQLLHVYAQFRALVS